MKTFKLLCLGNSFSVDATHYLYKVIKNQGFDNIIIGNLFIPGCSLEQHSNNIDNNLSNYDFYYNDNDVWLNKGKISFKDSLNDEDWDYVTLQQASHFSGILDSFEPYLNNIINFINNEKENIKIYWHETWAYEKNNTHPDYYRYGNSQDLMYQAIKNISNDYIKNNSNIINVIDNGTKIQSLRSTSIGDNLTVDGYHLNEIGRLATAINIYKVINNITNANEINLNFRIKEVDNKFFNIIKDEL